MFAYFSFCVTDVTCCITVVVVNVFTYFSFCITFVTCCIAVIVVNVICNFSCCTTFITCCVTSVIVNVFAYSSCFATYVTVCIASIIVNVFSGNSFAATYVTICITSIVVNVICNFSCFTAEVTICIAIVIVCVLTSNCKSIEDLSCDVVVTLCTCAKDNGVRKVSHEECFEVCIDLTCCNCCFISCFCFGNVNVSYVSISQGVNEGVCRCCIYEVTVKITEIYGCSTEIECYTVKCVVTAKNNYLSCRIDSLDSEDSFKVLVVEVYVAVEVRLCGEYESINYRDFNCECCVFTKLCSKLILAECLEECEIIAHCVDVLVEHINNVDFYLNCFGNTCTEKFSSEFSASLFDVRNVVFANECYPIHCCCCLTSKEFVCKELINCAVSVCCKHCNVSRNCFVLEKVEVCKECSECVVSVFVYSTSEVAVDVFSSVTEELVDSECADVGFIITNCDKVCAHDFNEINVVPAHLVKLFSAKAESVCKNVCIVCVVTDSNVIGIYGNCVFTVKCIVDVEVNSRIDLSNKDFDLGLNDRSKFYDSGVDNVLESLSSIVSNFVANSLKVFNESVKAFCYENLESCVELFKESSCVDEVDESITELEECILKDSEELILSHAAFDSSDDFADCSINLFDCSDNFVYNNLDFKDECVDFIKSSFDLSDCAVDSVDNYSVLVLKSLNLSVESSVDSINCCLKFSVASSDFSFNSFNCSLKFSVDSSDFSFDSILCFANSCFELLFEDSDLSVSLISESDDLTVENFDLLISLIYNDFDLAVSLILEVFNSVLKFTVKTVSFCLEVVDLFENVSSYNVFEVNELFPSFHLDFVKSVEDFVDYAVFNELIPSDFCELAAEFGNKVEDVCDSSDNLIGCENVEFNTESFEVYVDKIPNSVTVLFVPVNHSLESCFGVIHYELNCFGTEVVSNVSDNRKNDFLIFNKEFDHIVAVSFEECDYLVGVLVEPVVEVHVKLGSELNNSLLNHINELSVFFRVVSLEVIVSLNSDVSNCDSSAYNVTCNVAVEVVDDALKLFNCVVVVCFKSFDSILEVLLDSSDLVFNVCVDFFDSVFKSLFNSFNFSSDSCFSFANCIHKLFVKNSKLLFSLSVEDFDLLVSLVDNNTDLLFSLSIHSFDLRIEVVTAVDYCNTEKACECFNVFTELVKKSNNLCVCVSVEVVSFFNDSNDSINCLVSFAYENSELCCEFFASDVFAVVCNPSFSVSDVTLNFFNGCDDTSDCTIFYCLCVCVSISIVIIFLNEVEENKNVLNCLVLCCVIFCVCLLYCFKESIVTSSRGVSAKTVTDHASAHKTEKTSNCFVGLESYTEVCRKTEQCEERISTFYCCIQRIISTTQDVEIIDQHISHVNNLIYTHFHKCIFSFITKSFKCSCKITAINGFTICTSIYRLIQQHIGNPGCKISIFMNFTIVNQSS